MSLNGLFGGESKSSFKNLEEALDLWMLEKHRRIFICSQFDDQLARDVIKKVWYLSSLDNKTPITIVINSGGGSVTAGMAIWDQIQGCGTPIHTIVTGVAASMAAVLMLIGEKRVATKNARIMVHQPSLSGWFEGQTTDLEIQADEMGKTRAHLVKLMHERSGIEESVLDSMIDRDKWMNAQEAVDVGLLQGVVSSIESDMLVSSSN